MLPPSAGRTALRAAEPPHSPAAVTVPVDVLKPTVIGLRVADGLGILQRGEQFIPDDQPVVLRIAERVALQLDQLSDRLAFA